MTMVAVRKQLQGNKIGLILAGIMFILAIAIATTYFLTHGTRINSYVTFYSDDDGKTYYRDSIYNLPPYEHDGKVANRAVVFTDGSQTFVGYLERYTPDTRKKLQDVYDSNPGEHFKAVQAMAAMQIYYSGTEWKLPGPGHQWTLRARGSPTVLPPNGGDDVSNLLVVRP
jgi:hypothetical protein